MKNMNMAVLHKLKTKMKQVQSEWLDELPNILWAYQTTTQRTTTQGTPFAQTFGVRPVIPTKVGVPLSRTQNFISEVNNKEIKYNLDMIEQKEGVSHNKNGKI